MDGRVVREPPNVQEIERVNEAVQLTRANRAALWSSSGVGPSPAPPPLEHSQLTRITSVVYIVRSPLVGREPVQAAAMIDSTESVSLSGC